MDEETAIINSNTRNEKIRNFFVNNKKLIVSSLLIILIALVSYFAFEEFKEQKQIRILNLLCLERLLQFIVISQQVEYKIQVLLIKHKGFNRLRLG